MIMKETQALRENQTSGGSRPSPALGFMELALSFSSRVCSRSQSIGKGLSYCGGAARRALKVRPNPSLTTEDVWVCMIYGL